MDNFYLSNDAILKETSNDGITKEMFLQNADFLVFFKSTKECVGIQYPYGDNYSQRTFEKFAKHDILSILDQITINRGFPDTYYLTTLDGEMLATYGPVSKKHQ